MYIPAHFEMDADVASELLASAESAQVVAAYPEGPEATLLPVLWCEGDGLGSLITHVTRTNPLWKKAPLGEVLAIVSGPDAYIDPEWDPSNAEARGVPTWNYATVHAYGELIVHDDQDWTRDCVTRLSTRHGYDLEGVAPASMDGMLRSIVGLELRLTRVLAKSKLSQNKTPASVEAFIAGLEERGQGADADLADAMREQALPHAVARAELVQGLREGRSVSSDRR